MNKLALSLWKTGDLLYRKCRQFDFEDYRGDNIFRITVKPYRGPDIAMGERCLKHGDLVGELHLYNYRLHRILFGVTSEVQLGFIALREVRKSLPLLTKFLDQNPKGQVIEALVGITVLHQGAAALGFDVFDLEDTWYKKFKNFYMRLMMQACHPAGRNHFRQKRKQLIPKRIVMMKDIFFSKYGQKSIIVTK